MILLYLEGRVDHLHRNLTSIKNLSKSSIFEGINQSHIRGSVYLTLNPSSHPVMSWCCWTPYMLTHHIRFLGYGALQKVLDIFLLGFSLQSYGRQKDYKCGASRRSLPSRSPIPIQFLQNNWWSISFSRKNIMASCFVLECPDIFHWRHLLAIPPFRVYFLH